MNEQDVRFDSAECTPAGTFTEVVHPVAAALLITGSGRSNRDSDAELPFRQVLRAGVTRSAADALANARMSTLGYDKRGVGASGGDYLSVGMDERLADARAALRWLAARLPRLVRMILRLMHTDAIRVQREHLSRVLASSSDVVRMQGMRTSARWIRDFVGYDPAPALKRVAAWVTARWGQP